jgi:AraC-like DNA-binding protein
MKNISRAPKDLQMHRISIGGEVFLTTVNFEAGTVPSGLHYHSGCELLMIESGEMMLFAGDKSWHVQAGDLCLIGENVYHYLLEETPAVRTSIGFTRRGARAAGQVLMPNGDTGATVFQDPRLFAVLDLLKEEQRKDDHAVTDALLSVILGRSLRLCGTRNADAAHLPARSLDDVREVLIDDYFSDRYDEALTPGELASQLGVGTRQLSRILLEIYGKSFGEVLTDMRMEAAKDLLKNTDMPQGEIASAVGYRQQSNFFRTFRSREGCTPGVYRSRHVGRKTTD